MKKRRLLFFIILLIAIALIIWFFSFLSSERRQEVIEDSRNLFPFGQIENTEVEKDTEEENTEEESQNEQEGPGGPEGLPPQPKLRKISNFPTGGFIPVNRVDAQVVLENNTDSEGVSFQSERVIEVENSYVRYGEIQDGSIYETKVTPYSLSEENIVENFIPNTEKIVFTRGGDFASFQYWNPTAREIETYLGNIRKINLSIQSCPFDFTQKIELDSEGGHVSDLHKFLNRNPRTMIAQSGINSPGNEGSKALEATITAIKNFQSLNELDIDGVTGPATRAKMKEICREQQKEIAQKEFDQKEKKFELRGKFLTTNIISIDSDVTSDNFFYIQNTEKGSLGNIYDPEADESKLIFSSPLKEIYTYWNGEEAIEISTKPSYKAETYTYSMDTAGDYHKSIPQDYGMLSLASGDNTQAIVSRIQNNQLVTSIRKYENSQEQLLSVTTLADKCTWSKNNIDFYCAIPKSLNSGEYYPDAWYQGLEIFTDSIYKINSETLETTLLSDMSFEYNQFLDISSIMVDEKDEYLYFIDKSTEHLWSYRLFDL